MFDKIIAILNFEYKKDGEEIVTMGSIVFGGIIRLFLIMMIIFFVVNKYHLYQHLYVSLLFIWILVAMPAYYKYKEFVVISDEFEESTLCGSCRHFEKSAQLCKIYDEHPTKDYIPCDGDDWEYKTLSSD